jgi:hypothetical protein
VCAAAPQRDCTNRLLEHESLCAAQRGFMAAWNGFLRRRRIHADADTPAWCLEFAGEQAARAAGDPAFRRCLVAHLHSLWEFRLLAPEDVEAAMAAVVAAEAAAAAARAAGPGAAAAAGGEGA